LKIAFLEQREQSQACLNPAESRQKSAKLIFGAARAEPSLLELCRVATKISKAKIED